MPDAISVVTGTETLAVSGDPILMSEEVLEVPVVIVVGSRVEDSIMVRVDSIAVPNELIVEESTFVAEVSEDEPVADELMIAIEEPLGVPESAVVRVSSAVEVRVVGVLEPPTFRLLLLVEAEAEAVVDAEDSILKPDAMVVIVSSVEANFVDTPSVATELSVVVSLPVETGNVERSMDVPELVTANVSPEEEAKVVAVPSAVA